MKLRHYIIIGLFILINVVILYGLFGSKGPQKEEEKKVEFITHLEAKKVENVQEQFNVGGYGTVSSFNAVDISSEVQGKLQAGISLKPGVHFKKGQLLFGVEDTEARYSIRSRKSAYINLLVSILPDIRIDFTSEYTKWEDYVNAIKLNEPLPVLPSWKSEKEKVFLSTRNVLSEYFSIKSQEEQLKKFHVYAPFSGMVTDVFINEFAIVNPGVKVIRIVQTGNYEVAVSIPASHIDEIQIGTKTRIFTTSGKEKGAGTVVRISEVINRNTQSVDVFIKPVAYEGNKFIEGEYVEVKIDKTGEYSGIRVPLEAVFDNQVFVYSKKDSTLSTFPVNVLNESEKGVFVSGLKDDMIVITQEVLNYTDSTKFGIVIK